MILHWAYYGQIDAVERKNEWSWDFTSSNTWFFFLDHFFRTKQKTETDCFINCWKGNLWWNATNSVANFLVGLLIDKLWHMCKSKWNLFSLRLLNESFPCTLRESFRKSVNFNSWYISPARLWNHKSWQFLNNDVYVKDSTLM